MSSSLQRKAPLREPAIWIQPGECESLRYFDIANVTAPDPVRGDSPRGRRPPVVTVGAHVIFATATILFALLTAIGIS